MLFAKSAKEDATVVAMLASALRRDISFGTLLPDQKLKIDELRRRYGGSNHSMRESLRLLSAEGLVEAMAQRGFRVTSATEADLQDILLVRCEIERLGLSLALAHGDVAWEGRVMAAQHALRRAEEAVSLNPDDMTALVWDDAGRAFYASLIEASGSPRLISLQQKFFDQSRRFRLRLLREGRLDFIKRAQRQHQLLQAVIERDSELALHTLSKEIESELQAETSV